MVMTSDLTKCMNSCIKKKKCMDQGEEGCGKHSSLGLSAPSVDAACCLEPGPKPSVHPSFLTLGSKSSLFLVSDLVKTFL